MTASDLEAWLRDMPGEPLPFPTSPQRLYAPADLYAGFDPGRPGSLAACFDATVADWLTHGSLPPRKLTAAETIAARLHDTAIDRLVAALVLQHRPSVAMMGSHSIGRDHPAYLQFALIARGLRRRGFLVISGGGPGLMEAANFGAFMAPCGDEVLAEALEVLGRAPGYEDGEAWVAAAAQARTLALRRLPGGDRNADWTSAPPPAAYSLGLPTWYYSREWPNLFASHIGKYFFNSLREDGLVSVATAGIVFGMGEAGTVQEVFQNASLNYYRQDGKAPTPMVFVGSDYWSTAPGEAFSAGRSVGELRKPVLPLIRAMAQESGAPFAGAVQAYDSVEEVVEAIVRADCEATGPGCIAETRLAAIEP